MKRLIAALAALALCVCPAAAAVVKVPSLSVLDVTCAEDVGDCEVTVKRHGQLNGASSTFSWKTVDQTARAGSDYVARSQTLTFGPTQTLIRFEFRMVNDSQAEGVETIGIKLTKGVNSRLYDGSGVVTIPANDQVAPPPPPPPPPATQTCPDGSVIPADQLCPVAPPPPPPPDPTPTGWVPAPLAWNGYGRALQTCPSVYRTAEADRVGIHYAGVSQAQVYRVIAPSISQTANNGSAPSWSLVNPAGGDAITVWQSCLEGVKPAA